MMIFLLHCYSTAAMPYMGAEEGGTIVGVRLFPKFFFHVGFSSHYGGFFSMWWAFLLLVGAISRASYLYVEAFVLLREEWGGGGVGRGGWFLEMSFFKHFFGRAWYVPFFWYVLFQWSYFINRECLKIAL